MQPHTTTKCYTFIELERVDSTNNYATALAHAGMAQQCVVVYAHHQFKGKGQRNKEWNAAAGENITASIILQPSTLAPSQFFLLSMAVAVAIKEFLSRYLDADEVKIKWPNDIYWRDRKAGGILIENILAGSQWKFAIVGMGININQTYFEGLKAVSLKQITGKQYDVVALAKELCEYVLQKYNDLVSAPEKIIDEYQQHLYKWNEVVKLKKNNRAFEATIKGVTANGQLVVEHAMEERYDVGEIEWVI